MLGVLVDLENDAEGWVPLEVDYRPASVDLPQKINEVITRHLELASPFYRVALARGAQLAARLGVTHILDYS